jgi:hypothetical protein
VIASRKPPPESPRRLREPKPEASGGSMIDVPTGELDLIDERCGR